MQLQNRVVFVIRMRKQHHDFKLFKLTERILIFHIQQLFQFFIEILVQLVNGFLQRSQRLFHLMVLRFQLFHPIALTDHVLGCFRIIPEMLLVHLCFQSFNLFLLRS